MKSIYISILFSLAGVQLGFCQLPKLVLAEAIQQTIAQNPSIKIQRMETTIAQNNVFKGNAGYLPTINAVAGASYLNSFADVKLRTFQVEPEFIEIEEAGVETINANIGVEAAYALYDGKSRQHRYALLEGLSALEQAKQEALINDIASNVTQLYLEILKLQNQAAFLRENIENSKARIQKVEDRKQFGKASSLDVLQLQSALNTDEAALDDVILIKDNLIKDLNFLMGQPIEQAFEAVPVVEAIAVPSLDAINTAILTKNPQLILSRNGIQLADYELQLAEAAKQPVVAAFANVGYNYQRNDVQQLARINNAGVTIGLSATYNLFDGGVRKNRIQNAQVSANIERNRLELAKEQLLNQALQERSRLLLLQAQLKREQENLVTFEEAYAKTEDLFLVGKANNLALRDAQLARLNGQLRIDQIKIDLVKAQRQLQQLMGELVE
ncbi:MAG: TolC family protein [Bacteroidota bacterium]